MTKSLEELANLDIADFSLMNRRELSKVVSRLSSAANKRLKRMEQREIESPAYKSAQKSGGRFGAKGKTLNQLRAEYMRVSGFLKSKTSTISGYSKVKKEFYERVNVKLGEELTEDELSKFWQFYNEIEPKLAGFNLGSNDRQKFVYNVFQEGKEDTIEDMMNRAIAKLDESIENDDYEISDFFAIE